MDKPPAKLDYMGLTDQPSSQRRRLPPWVEPLAIVGGLYLLAILFRLFLRFFG